MLTYFNLFQTFKSTTFTVVIQTIFKTCLKLEVTRHGCDVMPRHRAKAELLAASGRRRRRKRRSGLGRWAQDTLHLV